MFDNLGYGFIQWPEVAGVIPTAMVISFLCVMCALLENCISCHRRLNMNAMGSEAPGLPVCRAFVIVNSKLLS